MTILVVMSLLLAQSSPGSSASSNATASEPAATTAAATGEPTPAASNVLSLEQAFAAAEAGNLDLKAARARLDQAREYARKAWSGYLPQVSLGASATLNDSAAQLQLPTGYFIRDVGAPQGPVFDPAQPTSLTNPPGAQTNLVMMPSGLIDITLQKKTQLGAQASVSQAVFVPSLVAAIRNAYLAGDIAELSVEMARREVLFGVAQLYYSIVNIKELLGVQRQLLDNNRLHERDAQTRFDAGTAPRIQLVRAQIDRIRAEQDVANAERLLASLKISLGTLLDREGDFEVESPATPEVAENEADLTRAADADRIDLRIARDGETLAQRSHNAVWLKYLPNVVASAFYRYANVQGFTGRNDAWAVTLGASWSIFDGGARESDLRDTEAKAVEAEANRRNTEIKVRDEVKRTLMDLQTAHANRLKAEEQRRLARENMQLVTLNYDTGVATQIEVSDATTALAQAELGYVAEKMNSQIAALRLLKVAGAFNPK